MIRYNIGSMQQASQKIQSLVAELAEQLQKMDTIAAAVPEAIKGGSTGAVMAEKITAKRNELAVLFSNLEGIVPLLDQTINELLASDQQISATISQL